MQKQKFRNEVIHHKIIVVPFEKKMCNTHLRWFSQVKGIYINVPMRRVESIRKICSKTGKEKQIGKKLLHIKWDTKALKKI